MYLQTPQIPFKGEIIRQFIPTEAEPVSILLVKLEDNPITPFVCWMYYGKTRSCYWGVYGSREFAEKKFEERVRKHRRRVSFLSA